MINLQFFPSRRIAFYMARMFVLRSLAVLAALVLILMTLDLLGESGKILGAGNGDAELWRYVSLRVPQLIARFLPFSVLLGTIITLASLNQHSEIVSMKAAGISAHQIIAPLVLASLGIAALNFVFNERFVTRANETLTAWQDAYYGPVPRDTGVTNKVWVRFGEDLILAGQVRGRGKETRLSDVTIYDRDGETLRTIVRARSGRMEGDGWMLEDVESFYVAPGTKSVSRSMIYGHGLNPTQFTLSRVSADEQSFWQLRDSIHQLRLAGRPTSGLEAGMWHKLAGPLSSMLMPLLAAIAAFGLARAGQLMLRAVAGMALGFAYFVVDNFSLAMGNLGAYPPILAAWAPFALFLLIGETVLIRTEE
jgi:lipopolysaccharide export system permease protein